MTSMGFLNEVIMSIVLQVKELEKIFFSNNYDGDGNNWFELHEGKMPVMLSAPHTVNHFSRGKMKYAEIFTGGITEYLHEQTHCHIICVTRYKNLDANSDPADICKYKQKLLDYIAISGVKVLIDLHGMKVNPTYAMELGTGGNGDPTLNGYNLIADIVEETMRHSLNNYLVEDNKQIVRNIKFAARGENTITNFISSQLRIPCLQIEIGGEYRDIRNPERLEALVVGLQSAIENISRLDFSK